MKILLISIITFIFFSFLNLSAQVEYVPLDNPVYSFLKNMSVKKIINNINDDNPNLSRQEITNLLNIVESKKNQLSNVEKSMLDDYHIEFIEDEYSRKNTFVFTRPPEGENYIHNMFSDKKKYFYTTKKDENTFTMETFGSTNGTTEIKPDRKQFNSMIDMAWRLRGTLFGHLGYSMLVDFGFSGGNNHDLASYVNPIVKTSFKFNENIENIRSFDYTNGYIKYYTEPAKDMNLSIQLGREKTTFGFGYSNSLFFSGNNPDMDFIKFNFNYGVFHFSSFTASTVGEYNVDYSKRYTKYLAANSLKLSFDNLFDFGIYEGIVYADRGIELGYMTPFAFYKYLEMSLQDRDNGVLGVEFQTHCFKGIEFQGTFFLDEDILNNLSDLQKSSNKTAYQIGTYIYEPFNIQNLSLVLEYTKIRPYVYSHIREHTTYTAYGLPLGHIIGPNSDQFYAKLGYYFTGRVAMFIEYQHIRSGKNIYDNSGNLLKNVGGDINIPFRIGVDNDHAYFLDGIRINDDIFKFNFRIEPARGYIFNFVYYYDITKNKTTNTLSDFSFAYLKLTVDY